MDRACFGCRLRLKLSRKGKKWRCVQARQGSVCAFNRVRRIQDGAPEGRSRSGSQAREVGVQAREHANVESFCLGNGHDRRVGNFLFANGQEWTHNRSPTDPEGVAEDCAWTAEPGRRGCACTVGTNMTRPWGWFLFSAVYAESTTGSTRVLLQADAGKQIKALSTNTLP